MALDMEQSWKMSILSILLHQVHIPYQAPPTTAPKRTRLHLETSPFFLYSGFWLPCLRWLSRTLKTGKPPLHRSVAVSYGPPNITIDDIIRLASGLFRFPSFTIYLVNRFTFGRAYHFGVFWKVFQSGRRRLPSAIKLISQSGYFSSNIAIVAERIKSLSNQTRRRL